jgi:hypothetical protein
MEKSNRQVRSYGKGNTSFRDPSGKEGADERAVTRAVLGVARARYPRQIVLRVAALEGSVDGEDAVGFVNIQRLDDPARVSLRVEAVSG